MSVSALFRITKGFMLMKNCIASPDNSDGAKTSENKNISITKNIEISMDIFCDFNKYPRLIPINMKTEAARNIGSIKVKIIEAEIPTQYMPIKDKTKTSMITKNKLTR